jgi:hypothetical protein
MRTIEEINEEFGQMDENGQLNYVFGKYNGVDQRNPFTYDPVTFKLTVSIKYIEEEGRTDLVNIEPLEALNVIRGIYTEQYMAANHNVSRTKEIYADATGHSLRTTDALLTVWFD